MHSKIFQVSSSPITPENYFSEERYYDGFVGSIADYTANIPKNARKQCIKYLSERLSNAVVYDSASDKFTVIDLDSYFKWRYEGFTHYRELLQDINYESFVHNAWDADSIVRYISDTISDKYGYYVDSDCDGLNTIDCFLRTLKNGDCFYIGAVIDYHF